MTLGLEEFNIVRVNTNNNSALVLMPLPESSYQRRSRLIAPEVYLLYLKMKYGEIIRKIFTAKQVKKLYLIFLKRTLMKIQTSFLIDF